MLTREAILSVAPSLPREEVEVESWGGSVYVRGMTAGERDRFEVLLADGKRKDFRATLVVFSVCDEAGKLVFSEKDIPTLTAQPCQALDAVSGVALRLSGFTSADTDALRKNSEGDPSEDSP